MNEKILSKAHEKMTEMYGDEPDVSLLSRFYDEKRVLEQSSTYLQTLELVSKISSEAKKRGEHIVLKGAECSLFIAYLLGTVDINPLPMHEYCPNCKRLTFLHREGTAFDKYTPKCNCGGDMLIDGYDIPFEPNVKRILRGSIRVYVSESFFYEAQRILENENSDGADLKISIKSDSLIDRCRVLERATGIDADAICRKSTSWIYHSLNEDELGNIPEFETEFMKGMISYIPPKNFGDLLKLLGFAHSTNVWKNNADELYSHRKMTFSDIPTFCEDIYSSIVDKLQKQGVYSTGFACDVTEKVRKGYYAFHGSMDEESFISLINLGFDIDFILFIEKIEYMVSKTYAVATLKELLPLLYYRLHFKDVYNDIVVKK